MTCHAGSIALVPGALGGLGTPAVRPIRALPDATTPISGDLHLKLQLKHEHEGLLCTAPTSLVLSALLAMADRAAIKTCLLLDTGSCDAC